MHDSDNVFDLYDTRDNEDESELYITFPDKHIPPDGFEGQHLAQNLISGPCRDFIQMSMAICDFMTEHRHNVTQCVHVIDTLAHELQTLNTEQKQSVDNITN